MDFGLKSWILLVGALIITAVLAHGLWLARQRARRALRMDLEPAPSDRLDPELLYSPELPNGGARVVSRPPPAGPVPEQQRLPNIDPAVPVLLEPVDDQDQGESQPRKEGPDQAEDATRAAAPLHPDQPIKADQPVSAGAYGQRRARRAPPPKASRPNGDRAEPEEIIAFNVLARGDAGLPGGEVVRFVTDAGLSYGEMNIFHRMDGDHAEYSMANAVEPGTFDLATIDESELRGLSFFLRLPGPRHPVQALDHMIHLVRALAERFDAVLLDGQRNVLTAQGMEHAREQVRLFERRRLTRRA